MRYVIAGVLILVLLGALAAIKFSQISGLIAAGEAMGKAGPPPEAVATSKIVEATWDEELTAVGTISAGRGVAISNEVPGEVRAIRFESGAEVKQGQILVELDSTVERAELRSLVARRNLAKVQVERTRKLIAEKAITQSQLDADEANLESAAAEVARLQAQIERKVLRAPFAGRLGIRQVNLGQYLQPGTLITDLQSSEAVAVDFDLPQRNLTRVAVGMPVRISAQDFNAEGTISAIEPQIDPVTRSVSVRAVVARSQGTLSPGMFVQVGVVLPEKRTFLIVPATALVRASYGDSVFIVEDKDGRKVARQQFVKTGEARGDFVALLDGVKAKQEVVVSGAFKLRNGAPVAVDNSVQLKPSQAPKPENR